MPLSWSWWCLTCFGPHCIVLYYLSPFPRHHHHYPHTHPPTHPSTHPRHPFPRDFDMEFATSVQDEDVDDDGSVAAARAKVRGARCCLFPSICPRSLFPFLGLCRVSYVKSSGFAPPPPLPLPTAGLAGHHCCQHCHRKDPGQGAAESLEGAGSGRGVLWDAPCWRVCPHTT
jgi:hypothetical protein